MELVAANRSQLLMPLCPGLPHSDAGNEGSATRAAKVNCQWARPLPLSALMLARDREAQWDCVSLSRCLPAERWPAFQIRR